MRDFVALWQARALMAAQAAAFAGETAILHASHQVGVMPLALVRSAGGLLLAVALSGGGLPWKTHSPGLMALRCGVTVGYLWISVLIYRALPLGDATALSFTLGLWAVVYGVFILGEPASRRQVLAVFIGLGATALIAHPDVGAWNWLYALAVGGAALNAAALGLSRQIERSDTAIGILFWVSLSGAVASLPGALNQPWPSPSMPVLFAIAILGPLGALAGIAAARMAPLGTLAPVTFLRLPIAMGLGVAIFGEMPTTRAIIGAAAILVANAFTWSRGKPYT